MFPTTQNNPANLASALTEATIPEANATGGTGKAFLKLDAKNGHWLLGRDAEEVTGEEIIINTYSFQHGWVLWVNKSPTKIMAPFTKPLPERIAAQAGNEPSEARGFEARFEDDPKTVVVYESSTHGARQGSDKLLAAIKQKAVSGEERFLFPVVLLNTDSYQSKHGSTVFNPVFDVIDWADKDGERESKSPALATPVEETTQPMRKRRRATEA